MRNSSLITEIVREKLLPKLNWMRSLQSLVIHRPFRLNTYDSPNNVLHLIMDWLFDKPSCSPWPTLEQLWIYNYNSDSSNIRTHSVEPRKIERLWVEPYLIEDGPFVKSIICLGKYGTKSRWMLEHDRFYHLEHLGGIADFGRVDGFPDLKYAGGHVTNIEVLFTYIYKKTFD